MEIFCHSLLLQLLLLLLLLKSYNLKKLLLLLLVVPSPELILVLKHPLYLLYASPNKLTPQNMFMIQKTVFFTA